MAKMAEKRQNPILISVPTISSMASQCLDLIPFEPRAVIIGISLLNLSILVFIISATRRGGGTSLKVFTDLWRRRHIPSISSAMASGSSSLKRLWSQESDFVMKRSEVSQSVMKGCRAWILSWSSGYEVSSIPRSSSSTLSSEIRFEASSSRAEIDWSSSTCFRISAWLPVSIWLYAWFRDHRTNRTVMFCAKQNTTAPETTSNFDPWLEFPDLSHSMIYKYLCFFAWHYFLLQHA